jgi:hypothetical protein
VQTELDILVLASHFEDACECQCYRLITAEIVLCMMEGVTTVVCCSVNSSLDGILSRVVSLKVSDACYRWKCVV